MHTILKKLTSLVLVAFMVLSMVPIVAVTANAAEGDQTYEKITSTPADWSGTYLIVYEAGNVAFNGALTTLDAENNTVPVAISDGKITGDFSANAFSINADGTTIQSASSYYIGQTTNGNGLKSSQSSSDYTNSISLKADYTVDIISSGAYLRYNSASNQNRFRYYKSSSYTGQKAITLYKLVDTSTPDPTVPTECEHANTANAAEVPATCTTPGTTAGVICSDCGAIISGCEEIAATGHTEVIDEAKAATCTETGLTEGKHCSVCNEVLVAQTVVPMVAHNYENDVCTVCGNVAEIFELVTNSNSLKAGDKIIIVASGSNVALSTTQNSSNRGQASIDKLEDGTIKPGTDVQKITLEAGTIDKTFAFKVDDGYLYAASSSNNYLKTKAEKDDNASWIIKILDGVTTVQAQGSNTRNLLKYNDSSSLFSCYSSGQADISIYKQKNVCLHANTTDVPEEPATCTETGYTAGVYCNDCGIYISGHDEIAALGHNWLGWTETTAATCTATGIQTGTCSRCDATKTVEIPTTDHTYVDGTCSECGAEEPSASETSTATLSFASTDNRSSWNSEQQVWEQNNVKLINNKTSASTAIIDASNPARFYKSSTITIEHAGMTKIEFTCNTADYATALGSSITDATVTVDDKIVTVTFTEAKDSFTISSLSKQVRLDSLTVTCKSSTGSSTESPNPIVKWNITLEDNLKVNFHLDLNEGEQVYLKVGGAEVAYNLSDLTKTDDGYYVATVSMAAAQMTDDINVQVINLTNEKLLANKTYSIRGYADAVLGSEKYPETTKALVNEMLNYGGAAQAFFGYNTGNLANAGITGAGVTPVPESVASDMNKTNDSDGCITFYGASLVYRDKIAVRYYFDVTNAEGLKFTADGNECEAVQTGGHYMIEVPDICPQDYDTQIHVIVTNAEGHSATVSYGPMNYIVRMYKKAADAGRQDIMDLLQALYNYHLAAKAYIAAQNP